jgi:hypothetical protein
MPSTMLNQNHKAHDRFEKTLTVTEQMDILARKASRARSTIVLLVERDNMCRYVNGRCEPLFRWMSMIESLYD